MINQTAIPKHSITSRLFEIARPKRQSHVQYYGYAVSQEWLIWFSKKFRPEDRNDMGVTSKQYFEGLAKLANIDDFSWKHCFDPNGGSVNDEEPKNIPIDTVEVLYVCSDEEGSIQKCPDEEKLEVMTALLGHGPKWWAGCSR
jgi:hypothetical protein